MKSAAFIEAMSSTFNVPQKTMVTYTRFLKEAGLLTTGARGVNAPHMTPMDASRVTIALLTSNTPGQAVERVGRFGPIPFNPEFKKVWPWYENIGEEAFRSTYEGETLEEVLAYIYALVGKRGFDSAAKWFDDNRFFLRINDFNVLAEIVFWKFSEDKPVGEITVPFQGNPYDNRDFPVIKGHIRTTREASSDHFFGVGTLLAGGDDPENPLDGKGRPIWEGEG